MIPIIDDDLNSLEDLVLGMKMTFPNYEIEQFQYPEEFENANITNIQILILDIMFAGDGEFEGGFDRGIEYYFEFKEKNPDIIVILFTNKTKLSIDKPTLKIIENNKDIYIEKPSVDIEGFCKLVRETLNK